MQQQQTQALPIKENIGNTAVAEDTLTNSQEISKRLAKRHSNWLEAVKREMHPQQIEWANPCGGVYVDTGTQATLPPKKPVRKILRYLQNTTMDEYKTIKIETPVIDISDIKEWRLHRGTYKFLPALKAKSNVALRRWHRHMQMYVASFSYLRRAQMYWDQHKLQRESEISKELQKLKRNSLSILCEIEMAINQTTLPVRSNDQGKRTHPGVHTIKRAAMEKRLKFQTPLQHLYANHEAATAEPHDVNPIDLKFLKNHYFAFVRGMVRILRVHTKKAMVPSATQRGGSSSGSSSKSAPLPASEHSFVISSSADPSTNSKSNTSETTMKKRHRSKSKNSGARNGNRAASKSRQH